MIKHSFFCDTQIIWTYLQISISHLIFQFCCKTQIVKTFHSQFSIPDISIPSVLLWTRTIETYNHLISISDIYICIYEYLISISDIYLCIYEYLLSISDIYLCIYEFLEPFSQFCKYKHGNDLETPLSSSQNFDWTGKILWRAKLKKEGEHGQIKIHIYNKT